MSVAALRAEPRDGAEQVTQAVRGEPLWLVEERDGWARVRTAYDYDGWVRADALRGDVLAEARRFLDVPYEWGGTTQRGLDCSGLVHLAFRCAGWIVPRDAHRQEAAGVPVAEDALRPGDLISYGDAGGCDHVAPLGRRRADPPRDRPRRRRRRRRGAGAAGAARAPAAHLPAGRLMRGGRSAIPGRG